MTTITKDPNNENLASFAGLADEGLDKQTLKRMQAEHDRLKASLGSDGTRRVLIIGGSGYIGCPLTSHLLSHGYRVRNLDLSVYNNAGAALGYVAHPRYEFMYGDMGDDKVFARALEDVSDVIILAGLVGDPITKAFPAQSRRINDESIIGCIERLNGHGLNKVVFVSTCSNYGLIGEDEVADEGFALNPLSLYAKSKVAAEQYLLSLKGSVDFHPTILRFATAFGLSPRMRFDLTVNEFTRDLSLGNELVIYDAETWRPYCHVKDFARLIDRVLRFPADDVSFEVFNAGGDDNNHTKQSIVNLIQDRLPGTSVKYRSNSSDPRNYRVNFKKLRERLKFQPAYSVADGIDEIIWTLRAHLLDDVDKRKNFYGNHDLPGLAINGTRSSARRRKALAEMTAGGA